MSSDVSVDLVADGWVSDKTEFASITPSDIMEMSEQMESTPLYDDNGAKKASKGLNPYETSDPNEPTLLEQKIGDLVDRVEGAIGKGCEVPRTLKELISAQEAFDAKDYQLAASHLSGIEKIFALELSERSKESEVPVISPVKRGKMTIRPPVAIASPAPVTDAPKIAPDLNKAIDDLFSPVSIEEIKGPPMMESAQTTAASDQAPIARTDAVKTPAASEPGAKPGTGIRPISNNQPKTPETLAKEPELLPKKAPSRILRPKAVAAPPQPEETPARLHQRKTVDLRAVQDDNSGSLSVTKKREAGPKSHDLNLIFLLTEARLAISEGKIEVAREKYELILAQEASNKEALDFKNKFPTQNLTQNILKRLEAQAIEAFLRSDYTMSMNLYKEILKASPRHKAALEGVSQCEALLKKRPGS